MNFPRKGALTEQPLSVIFNGYPCLAGWKSLPTVLRKRKVQHETFEAARFICHGFDGYRWRSNGAPASVLTAVPGEPGPIYPTNNELIYTYGASQLEFQWSSAGTLGTVYYDVQVSTDPTFTNSSAIVSSNLISGTHSNCGTSNQAPNWVSPYAYQPATTYYWRIQAYDGTCNGDFVTGGSGWAVYTFLHRDLCPDLGFAPLRHALGQFE